MAEDKINGWNAELARMVIVSDFLLFKYRHLSKNGRIIGSPYESLVFGKIYRLSGGMYGYCSLSKEKIAYELGAGYDSILRAFKNLEKDKYIGQVARHKKDHNTRTKCYVANLQKLYDDSREWEIGEIGFSTDSMRKNRRYESL